MRSSRTVLLLMMLALLAGCGQASKKAHEVADQNLYQAVEYANASQPGPTVIVLPGQVSAVSYEFLARVSPGALRDFAEAEMGKCNFKVLDRAEDQAMFGEIAVAANLGDASVASKFKKFKLTPPQWLVSFDIVEVQARSTGFKHTDKQSAAMAGAFMGSLLLGDLGAKAGGATLGSISSAEEQREWSVTMRYRVMDGATGELLHEGSFSDTTTVFREIKGFMGFDQTQAGGVQIFRSVQGLVQKSIQEIDEKHKLPAVAEAEQVKARQAKALAKALAKAPAEREKKPGKKDASKATAIACTTTSIGGVSCLLPSDWKAGNIPSVRDVALAANPGLAMLEDKGSAGKKSAMSGMAQAMMAQTAGPVVTLSAPGGPLAGAANGAAITGPGVEGRMFVLTGMAGKADPAAVQGLLEKHFQQTAFTEALGVEKVESKNGDRPVAVYKFIKVERRKVEKENTAPVGGDDKGRDDNTKTVSVPHYHNMAVSVLPRGGDLVLVLMVAPEDSFTTQLQGFKQMVGSI